MIALFSKLFASDPDEIIESFDIKTFSNETSEHVWPSTVGNEVTETPSELASTITRAKSLPDLQETINLEAFAHLKPMLLYHLVYYH